MSPRAIERFPKLLLLLGSHHGWTHGWVCKLCLFLLAMAREAPSPPTPHPSPASFLSFLPAPHLPSHSGLLPMSRAHQVLSSQHFARAVSPACDALPSPSTLRPGSHLVYPGEPSLAAGITVLLARLDSRPHASLSCVSSARGSMALLRYTSACVPSVVRGRARLTGMFPAGSDVHRSAAPSAWHRARSAARR